MIEKEAWKEDPGLPDNWMMKKTIANTVYCLPDGKFMNGKESAITYLKLQSEDRSGDIAKLKELKISLPSIPRQRKRKEDERRRNMTTNDWRVADDIYPVGWKIKDTIDDHKRPIQRIMSTSGEIFKNRREALSYMNQNNFPNDDIQKLLK